MVPPTSLSDRKAALRREMRARRRAFVAGLSPSRRHALEAALAEAVRPCLGGEALVAAYVAVGSEIDPTAIAPAGALPWFERAGAPMCFRAGPAVERGPYGVPQPSREAPAVEPELLLVPLIAFDREGRRLGQGGGHYDRALAGLRARGRVRAIGLAWDVQLVEALPVEPWDEGLDAVATPSGLWPCRRVR